MTHASDWSLGQVNVLTNDSLRQICQTTTLSSKVPKIFHVN
jgi:hypothetical protein